MSLNTFQNQLNRIEAALYFNKPVFTLAEFSRYAGISKRTAYGLTSQGKIPFSRPNGKMVYISKADADDFLLSNRVASKEELNQQAANFVMLRKPSRKGAANA
ncbi:hypothetical protein GCM10027037_12470 [Mucilaginibacter koreensis]